MARYQVVLAYDGSRYSGFQRQRSGMDRTVQGEVETALHRIGWDGRTILSAGRTDTGVHASGQVIAFDLEWKHTLEELQAALNFNLPDDIAARSVQPAAGDFHPRYAAKMRCYRYRIYCQPVRDPLRERYAWRVWPPVEDEKLQQAAGCLPGTHDFASFGTPPRPNGGTVREVFRSTWQPEPPEGLSFWIAANAFLFHMVRRLVGFQVAIAQGRIEPQALADLLQEPRTGAVRTLAPPNGLCLVEVVY